MNNKWCPNSKVKPQALPHVVKKTLLKTVSSRLFTVLQNNSKNEMPYYTAP